MHRRCSVQLGSSSYMSPQDTYQHLRVAMCIRVCETADSRVSFYFGVVFFFLGEGVGMSG